MRLQQLDVDKKPKIMIIPMIDIIFFYNTIEILYYYGLHTLQG